MFSAFQYSVNGLIFSWASVFLSHNSPQITIDYTDNLPFCASIEKPNSIEHIITNGKMFKLMGLKDGKSYSVNELMSAGTVGKYSRKHCYAISKIGILNK